MMTDRKSIIESAVRSNLYPRFLYKYREINDRSLDSILNSNFWFAQPKDFNDPFDCSLSESRNHKISDFKKYLSKHSVLARIASIQLKKARSNPSHIHKMAKDAREKTINERGVFSLSSEPDNMLLWSHYADSHKGMVICFDVLKDPEFFDVPVHVKYQKNIHTFEFFN